MGLYGIELNFLDLEGEARIGDRRTVVDGKMKNIPIEAVVMTTEKVIRRKVITSKRNMKREWCIIKIDWVTYKAWVYESSYQAENLSCMVKMIFNLFQQIIFLNYKGNGKNTCTLNMPRF